MSENIKSDKEKILELKAKIHELRLKKLLTIENLEIESKKLDSEIQDIQKKTLDETINFKVAGALIKAIDSRRGILRELRLAASFLTREELRLDLELVKLTG